LAQKKAVKEKNKSWFFMYFWFQETLNYKKAILGTIQRDMYMLHINGYKMLFWFILYDIYIEK